MTIDEYFGEWYRVIDVSEIQKITKSLVGKDICPKLKDIFKAFRICNLKNLRVVIIGQDPYPQKGVATGIAFANYPDTPDDSISSSLEILRDSVIDFTLPHCIINFDKSLESWGEQGVLLINTALSCETGKPESHSLMWRPFIKNFLSNLSKHTTGIVYVLMGSNAQSFESYINKRFNYIIRTKHPSWYARTKTKMPSEVWQKINDILIKQNGYGIEWYKEIRYGENTECTP